MSAGDADEKVEEAIRARFGREAVEVGAIWLTVRQADVLPDQGWKLHISSRASTFLPLLQAALSLLVSEGCTFKVARSRTVLEQLNDGYDFPANVGKAITVYPDQSRVRDIGLALAELLSGYDGPRVLSDRRVMNAAPVFYRFGPFVAHVPDFDTQGAALISVHGPDGERFDGEATLQYRQPPWVRDPFTGQGPPKNSQPEKPVLGDRFHVLSGIREAAQGNVYRAVDEHCNARVVIKQARAFVAERKGNDARVRLRNERRILQVLSGVSNVPAFVDHFQQGCDEFLVTSECAGQTLADAVRFGGPYLIGTSSETRNLVGLGTQLARALDGIHRRGVIMRDLTPRNVLVDERAVTILDFGIAAHDGLHLPGGTPGYSPGRQARDETPQDIDDLYALGMTLLFAATGLDPVSFGRDRELPRRRALQLIESRYGARPRGIVADIADMIGIDHERARSSLHRLSTGKTFVSSAVLGARLPCSSKLTPGLVTHIVDVLRTDLLEDVDRIVRKPRESVSAHDLNMHGGAAGIGLELLHHLDYPMVADRVEHLVSFTCEASKGVHLPLGLFSGVTGVQLLHAEAVSRGVAALSSDDTGAVPLNDGLPGRHDLTSGAAGVGLAHLRLQRLDPKPEHMSVVNYCVRCIEETSSFDESPSRGTGSSRDTVPPSVDPSAGAAHGLAGVTEFFLVLAQHTGDEHHLSLATSRLWALAERTPALIAAAAEPSASVLAASWCQGLTGVGRTLLRASIILGDESLHLLAAQAVDACIRLVPRMSALGQCCGAVGVGNFLIDLAAGGDGQYDEAAGGVASHVLLRSSGSDRHPRFVAQSQDSRSASWAMGIAGVLSYFRRLAVGGGPDCLPILDLGTAQIYRPVDKPGKAKTGFDTANAR